MADRSDKVWITGVGLASPLGNTYNDLAENLLAGKSGITRFEQFNSFDHPCKIAGSIGPLSAPEGWDPESFATLSDWKQLLLWTAVNALQDSGWWEHRSKVRIGLIIGMGAEWVQVWEQAMLQGDDRVHDPARDATCLTAFVRESLGLSGPTASVAAACASGNLALAQARRWVQRGWVDVCLAGACDRPITPIGMAGFGNLGALSKRNEEPTLASRPFDRGREGFVVGEGGALFVIERADRAGSRGARAYAEIAGVGATSDAYHLVIPSPDPAPCISAIRLALADARLNPDELDYINAHAPGTTVGDAFEARALREVLGDALHKVPVSSTKSMTGHLVTAASAVEAAACLAAFDHQAIPPTINLDDPDPECDLCHVPHEARPAPLRTILSNSFGFGGSNICVVFRKVG